MTQLKPVIQHEKINNLFDHVKKRIFSTTESQYLFLIFFLFIFYF